MKASVITNLTFAVLISRSMAAQHIVLTNDDGWAVAQLRDEYNALTAAGFEVILSAPAENRSGTGSSTAPPTTLTIPCEFDTCPVGAPAIGTDADDPNIHYVNSFPVDSVRAGIQTFAQERWGANPDFVVSGSNVGNNLGPGITGSGTVGAAGEAAKEGVPSFAFSGASASQVSYTTLTTDPTAASTLNAHIYTDLVLKFVNTILSAGPGPLLPAGVSVNVNFAPTTNCNHASNYRWVFTRIANSTSGSDIEICGTRNLPQETATIREGCIATVSVFNATTKADVPASFQQPVHDRLESILSCLGGGRLE